MTTSRLEAFSDGVIAVIITIMVMSLQVPNTPDWSGIRALAPKFVSYILSFLYVGIYWNNHHHLLNKTNTINGNIMWSNLFFLFTLSITPFSTAWMGEHQFQKNTTILYGIILMFNGVAYGILSYFIAKNEGQDSDFAKAIGAGNKEKISIVVYILGIAASFFEPYVALVFYYIVALMWIIPDKRLTDKD
ncbi:TMEM175 family protein [Soonwooa sp.]|uniref:TMEM175 family protein n=1 Tax=Soonwooa sp. TaxID=1938592 RepID=UPI002629DA69|nr:TMEM175 family protein [Soonwooa sp.]